MFVSLIVFHCLPLSPNDSNSRSIYSLTNLPNSQEETVEGCELRAGGATPAFASVAQLEGRPTNPVDDMESLWYCLAYLEASGGTASLRWAYEPQVPIFHF